MYFTRFLEEGKAELTLAWILLKLPNHKWTVAIAKWRAGIVTEQRDHAKSARRDQLFEFLFLDDSEVDVHRPFCAHQPFFIVFFKKL
jgi:hypothetical protein